MLAALDYSLLAGISVALVYLLGPRIRNFLRKRETIARSFGGGCAASYVFLQLFPEIESAYELLGDAMHFIALVSFLLVFGTEMYLLSRSARSETGQESKLNFWMHIGLSWIAAWLLVFALPEDVAGNAVLVVVGSTVIAVRLLYKDYVLHEHHTGTFESSVRYVLALAPIAAWLARTITTPSELVIDLLIAVLAGFLLHNVFRHELPGHTNFRFLWFAGGVASYAVLVSVIS